ncbi:MAG: DNA mismatch repair endonuclease MutL [Clostridia bacterium]|nr:DNA mismatch repair endonuclease MutL [Clostridia bacterium]
MPSIQVLPFAVANLIAAGEVVDRPSSVIKELLENAIDAGADQITVEIQSGGVKFMRVSDNGCGMAPEDLPTAIQRHATSKIRTAADLDGIATLGFRGEALAAISSVARVRILSRERDAEMGALLECHGGEIVSQAEAGCPGGTTIVVEDLFYNVPARRKFLKKDATEAVACATVVEKIALSHPEIALKYISDGEVKFRTAGNGDLSSTMYALFGREIARRSLWTDRTENGIRVYGYVSEPDLYRPNRNLENFFINGRYVKSRTANAAVEQAYSSKIPHDKFPVCVLHIEIAPGAVDVNVHPTKLEVKFTNEKLVFDAVYYAVLNALEAAASRPELVVSPSEQLPMGEQPKDKPESVRNPGSFWTTGDEARRLINAFVPQDGPKKRAEQIRLGETVQKSKPGPDTAGTSVRGGDWHTWRDALHSIPPSMQETGSAEVPAKQPGSSSAALPDTAPFLPDMSAEDVPQPPPEMMRDLPPMDPPPEEMPPELLTDIPPFAPEDIPHTENGIPTGGLPVPEDAPEQPEDAAVPADIQAAVTAEKIRTESGIPAETGTLSDVPPAEADPAKVHAALPEDCAAPEPYDAPEYLIIGEAFNTYILVQLEDRLLMIDKHAAHERIIFDELCRRMRERNHAGQILMAPYPVTLLQSEAVMLEEYGENIRALGFSWESVPASLSTTVVELTQIPDMLNLTEGTALFSDLITRLADATATVESASAAYFETRLWQASCKAAIKGGRVYDRIHLQWICDRLLVKPEKEGATVIRTCPHGRPVAFEIKKTSIERQFARLM